MFKRKYVLYEEWCNDDHLSYIGYARTEDFKEEGFNYISRGGSEGVHLYIFDSLKEALDKAYSKLEYIKFGKLNKKDLAFIEEYKKEN